MRAGLGTHVGAQALTLVHDRGERDGGDRIQSEHCADAPRLAKLLQRAAGGIHVLGDDTRQRIPERNLHCHAAIRVDVDQIVQGAECPLYLTQCGGRGGVHVECERERFGASRRRGRIRLGGSEECECGIARRFCGGACGVGLHEAQRQIGLVAHVGVDGDAKTIDVFVQSAHLGSQLVHLLCRGARLFECVGCFSTDHRVGIDACDRCELLVHLGEVLAQLRALGLERGNDAGVHQLPAIALDGATTLGEHGEQSLGATAQLFDAHEFVVHAGVSACGQLCFGCHHGGIQARQLGAQRALGLFTRKFVARQVRESRLEARDLATGEIGLQRTHLGDQRTVTTRGICLALEWLQVPAHLAQQVLCAQQVGLGALETTLGFLLALAVLQHTRCFFDDRATIFG